MMCTGWRKVFMRSLGWRNELCLCRSPKIPAVDTQPTEILFALKRKQKQCNHPVKYNNDEIKVGSSRISFEEMVDWIFWHLIFKWRLWSQYIRLSRMSGQTARPILTKLIVGVLPDPLRVLGDKNCGVLTNFLTITVGCFSVQRAGFEANNALLIRAEPAKRPFATSKEIKYTPPPVRHP